MLQMTHPRYGERVVRPEQEQAYLTTGWAVTGQTPPPELVRDKTIAEITAYVGGDVHRAREALDAELSKSKPRTTLVTALTAVVEQQNATATTVTSTDPEV